MTNKKFTRNIENAHNLKFDLEPAGFFVDLVIECDDFDIHFNLSNDSTVSYSSGDYFSPAENNSEVKFEITDASMINDENVITPLTNAQVKELTQLLIEHNS